MLAAALEFIYALVAAGIRYAGPWIVQGLLFLGVSFVTHKYVATPVKDLIMQSLSGAGSLTTSIINALASIQFDKAVTIIVSAHIVAASSRVLFARKPAAP